MNNIIYYNKDIGGLMACADIDFILQIYAIFATNTNICIHEFEYHHYFVLLLHFLKARNKKLEWNLIYFNKK